MSVSCRVLAGFALVAGMLLGGCASRPPQSAAQMAPTPAAREMLAPGGVLRVGVQAGNPYSMQSDGGGGYAGLAYDLGTELARWLGVPLELVEFGSMDRVLQAVKSEDVDVTVATVAEARRLGLDATLPMLQTRKGALALAMPRGRPKGLSYLSRFALTVQRDGTLQAAIERAGLRDVVVPAYR